MTRFVWGGAKDRARRAGLGRPEHRVKVAGAVRCVAAALRPLAAALRPLVAAVMLALLAPGCSRGPAPEQPLSTAQIGALNHGLGLMGQFDFEAARLQFQGSAQVHGNRWGLTNAAIALMNQSVDGAQERAIEEFRSILRAYDAPGVPHVSTPGAS